MCVVETCNYLIYIISSTFKTVVTFTYYFFSRILSTVASLAIPSVPSASIVTIVMILTSLNVSIEPIALLLAVEFLL